MQESFLGAKLITIDEISKNTKLKSIVLMAIYKYLTIETKNTDEWGYVFAELHL